MSYVQTVAKALTLPAIPDMKPAIRAVMPRPSKARVHNSAPASEARLRYKNARPLIAWPSPDEMFGQDGERQQARQNDDERHGHFESRTDDGRHLRAPQIFSGENALDH